jgi:hypothetical protein
MDTEKTFEDLVRERAYHIYIRRTQSLIWDYGRLGTQDGDYFQALHEITLEQKAVTNRIKDLV